MKSDELTFKDTPFSQLIKESKYLVELRNEYAEKSAEQRRKAADYKYHSAIASDIFYMTIGEEEESDEEKIGHAEILALAIDPEYAPAIASIGSYEYIFGRKDEAMEYFLKFTELPETTEDLFEIIEKAGDFLCDAKDYERAIRLYKVSIERFPDNALFRNCLSYCYAKLNRFEDAIKEARVSVKLQPENYYYLNDLGYTLIEAEQFDEAEEILEKAIEFSPPYYVCARNNLENLYKLKK